MDVNFSSRFFLSTGSWIVLANAHAERDELYSTLQWVQGQPIGFSHIFYCSDSTRSNSTLPEEFLLKNTVNHMMAERFSVLCDACSVEDKRDLISKLMSDTKEVQKDRKNINAQQKSLSQVAAALFIWGNLGNYTLKDCKIVLQILYLKMEIHSRVIELSERPRSQIESLRLMYSTAAKYFVENYHDESIRSELEKDGMYLLFKRKNASSNPNAFVNQQTQSQLENPRTVRWSSSEPILNSPTRTAH